MNSASASAFGMESSGTLSWVLVSYLAGRMPIDVVILRALLDELLAVRQMLWFRQNGAVAHCGAEDRQWVSATYPGK